VVAAVFCKEQWTFLLLKVTRYLLAQEVPEQREVSLG